MDNRKRIENIWFYYKKHILIGLAAVLVLAYLGIQKISTEKPDYHIGLVRSEALSAEDLNALNAAFTAAGQDLNGDGQVLVQIHTYYANLADDSENAGVNNACHDQRHDHFHHCFGCGAQGTEKNVFSIPSCIGP